MRWGLAPALALGLLAPPAKACAIDPYMNTAFPASLVFDLQSKGYVDRVWFDHPSEIYDHGILGRAAEPDRLFVQFAPDSNDCGSVITAGEGHVFEDTAPRLADLDRDGENEVIVVRTSVAKGAQLAVYGIKGNAFGLIAATDYIGQPHRWLAPAGIADFDGDGRVEIAYVDRPHLLGDLVFVRLEGKQLREIARLPGFTNHRIGDKFISGGVRTCGQGPELVLASKDWTRLLVVGWDKGPVMRDVGTYSAKTMQTALDCG